MGSDRPQGSRRPSSRTGPSTQVSWLLVLVSFPKHLSKELLDTTSSLHPWGTHGRHRYSIIWDEEILRKTGSLLEPGPEATSDTGTLGWCAGTQSVGLTHVWLWHSRAVCGRAECGPYPRLTLALWDGVWASRVWAFPTSDSGTRGRCVGVPNVGLTHVWLWLSGGVCGRAECGPYLHLTLWHSGVVCGRAECGPYLHSS